MCDDPDMEGDAFAAQDMEENRDTFDMGSLRSESNASEGCKLSPRRFRNNSYNKAVGSRETKSFNRSLAVRKKHNDESVRTRALLYQQITERGLNDIMDDDEESVSNPSSKCPSEEGEDVLRPLWSNLPGVRSSGILISMPQKERKRQEAMYELYTSEQSYFRSLTVLVDVFMASSALQKSATPTDYHHLFSNFEEIRTSSHNFLHDLEKRFRSSPDAVQDVCDIVQLHIGKGNFYPYVTYCSNEVYQQRAFQRLIKDNADFVKAMRSAESNPSCMSLPMHSFLLLPMQRITRLPLLIDTICQRCEIFTPSHKSAATALREASRVVKACNDRAKTLQRTEDMIVLQRQLEFKTKSFALVSQTRFLLKRGPLTKLNDDTVLGFKKLMRQDYHVFLFNDAIILTKKRSEDKYIVADFCYRHRLKVHDTDNEENAFQLILERNQDGNRVMLRLQAESPSSCARWLTCLKTAIKKGIQMKQRFVQVRIVRPFRSDEPDLITLQPADVLCVLQATSDGWYYGEKLVDGTRGWFPSSYAKEVLSERARESNFRLGTRMHGIETEI